MGSVYNSDGSVNWAEVYGSQAEVEERVWDGRGLNTADAELEAEPEAGALWPGKL